MDKISTFQTKKDKRQQPKSVTKSYLQKILRSKNLLAVLVVAILLSACDNDDNMTDAWGNFETTEVMVSAETQGKLMEFSVNQGQQLQMDQQVGLLDTLTYALHSLNIKTKKQAMSNKIKEVEAQVAVLQTQIKNLEKELRRLENLLKDGAATQQQYDDLKGKHDVLQQQINAAKIQKKTVMAELKAMDVQIMLAEDNLSKCRIRNPLNGTVLETFAEQSELVMPGKPLYKIADLTRMNLRAYISGDQLSAVRIGEQVTVLIDGGNNQMKEYPGTITWISDKAEFTPKTIQTREERVNLVYAMKVSVQNDGAIKSGMPGEVVFKSSVQQNTK
ncbi:MAG: HlyD family secretion protein [Bacteroidota bacterium]